MKLPQRIVKHSIFHFPLNSQRFLPRNIFCDITPVLEYEDFWGGQKKPHGDNLCQLVWLASSKPSIGNLRTYNKKLLQKEDKLILYFYQHCWENFIKVAEDVSGCMSRLQQINLGKTIKMECRRTQIWGYPWILINGFIQLNLVMEFEYPS